jgi:hypothetical protein
MAVVLITLDGTIGQIKYNEKGKGNDSQLCVKPWAPNGL